MKTVDFRLAQQDFITSMSMRFRRARSQVPKYKCLDSKARAIPWTMAYWQAMTIHRLMLKSGLL